jgi:regulator of nucleoside diphosphate kinase
MREYPIIVTERDVSRLRGLLGAQSAASLRDLGHLRQLRAELERALVLPTDEVPRGIVTIDSVVRLVDMDTGRRSVLTLVLPLQADVAERRISVLAPIGTALLGFRAGDDVEWTMPGGVRRMHIEHVTQPGKTVGTHRTLASHHGQSRQLGAH